MRTSPIPVPAARPPGWPRRVRARLLATRLDRDLDAGLPVVAGTVRAAHAERITSSSERHRLACGLQSALDRARGHGAGVSRQLPLRCRQLLADEDLIGQIVHRLDATQPVRPRGVARLRLLLTDGVGPSYTSGGGSVAAQLRGVLAAL